MITGILPSPRRPRRLGFRFGGLVAAAAAVMVLAASQAAAHETNGRALCLSDDKTAPELRVERCTAFIQSAGGSPEDRAKAFHLRGDAYINQLNWDAALGDYDEAIKLDPSDAAYFVNRAFLHGVKNNGDAAIRDFDEAIRLHPTADAFSGRGGALASKGEFDRAIDDYGEALRIGPERANLLMDRAGVYADKGDHEHAIRDVEQAFRIGTSDRMFGIYLTYRVTAPAFRVSPDGQELAFAGPFREGVAKEFERLLASTGTIKRVRLESGGGSVAEGRRFIRAIKARNLDTYVSQSCMSACSDAFLAGRERLIAPSGRIGFHQRSYAGMSRWQSAVAIHFAELRSLGISEEFARRASNTPPKEIWFPPMSELMAERVVSRVVDAGEFPDLPSDTDVPRKRKPADFFDYRGDKFLDKGEYERAMKEFDAALQLDPDDEFALMSRGPLYAMRDDPDRAIADFSRITELDPGAANAHLERGEKYRHAGNPEAAIRDFDEAIRRDPDDIGIYLYRGLAYALKKDHKRAIADFDRVIAAVPDHGASLMGRGLSHFALGDNDRAIEDTSRAILLDPDDAQGYVNRAIVFSKKGNLERAIEDRSQVIRLRPNEASGWNNRCWARAIIGQLQEALSDCNESLRLKASDANTLDSRAFTYLKMGEYEKAIEDYDAALALNPKLTLSLHGRGLAKLKRGDRAGGCSDVLAATASEPRVAEKQSENNLSFDPPNCIAGTSAEKQNR
jgi:tetratricopeptide (TPR) repeat protein